MITQKCINEISYKIIGCAIEVHKELGPGLLESVYEECFIEEMRNAGLKVESQIYIPIIYKGKKMRSKLKLDILVEDLIIVEDKAKEVVTLLDKAQTMTYMRLTDKVKGLLINFNCVNIKDQISSMVRPGFFQLPKA